MALQILVIDDERGVLDLFSELLSDQDATTEVYENPLEALDAISRSKFDAIITDIEMPGMNGVQLATCIKSSSLNDQTPIFVVSGHSANQVRQPLLERIGLVQILDKSDVTQVVEHVLKTLRSPPPKPVAYHPDLVNCLKNTCEEVLKAFLPKPIQCAQPLLPKPNQVYKDMIGFIVPIFGRRFYGSLATIISENFLDYYSKTFLRGGTAGEDIIGEISNQICGSIKHELNRNLVIINIGLPQRIDTSKAYEHLAPGREIIIPFESSAAKGHVGLCIGNPLKPNTQMENMGYPIFISQ